MLGQHTCIELLNKSEGFKTTEGQSSHLAAEGRWLAPGRVGRSSRMVRRSGDLAGRAAAAQEDPLPGRADQQEQAELNAAVAASLAEQHAAGAAAPPPAGGSAAVGEEPEGEDELGPRARRQAAEGAGPAAGSAGAATGSAATGSAGGRRPRRRPAPPTEAEPTIVLTFDEADELPEEELVRACRSYCVWVAPDARRPVEGIHTGPRAWTYVAARLETGAYRRGYERLKGYDSLDAAIEAWFYDGPAGVSDPQVFFW